MKEMGKSKLLIYVAVFIGVVILFLPSKRKMNMDYNCIVLDSCGNTMERMRMVTLEGYYKDYLFFQDQFEGNIRIEGIEEPDFQKEVKQIPITDELPSLIADIGIHKSMYHINEVGHIWSKEDFGSFVIELIVEGEKGTYLCFPDEQAFALMGK